VTEIFGASSALGPVVVSGAILVGSAVLFLRARRGTGRPGGDRVILAEIINWNAAWQAVWTQRWAALA
jgi:hypothetical protein